MKITSINLLKYDGRVKLVLGTSLPAYSVRLILSGKTYYDAFNIAEPYDRKTHVFYIPEEVFSLSAKAQLVFSRFKKGKVSYTKSFVPGDGPEAQSFVCEKNGDFFPGIVPGLIEEYDHKITVKSEEKEELFEGVTFTKFTCEDKDGAPVIISLIKTDLKHSELYIGTPDDSYESKKVKATIPDMILSAEKNGRRVLAAVNADFFDMFGDNHPSGLCVKNGRIIANGDSPRPFIGVTKSGKPTLTDLNESPEMKNGLYQAAAGLQMIVKDGKIYDYAPLEPFSYVRHPRTAAGITKDGSVLLLEVDGRIPAHSNGASLVDLALFMIRLGADRALNLDGGGSSAVYTRSGKEHILRTVPADLFFPNDKLIRKDFNAIFVTEK